jgi:DNA polymerase III epsilon subunit-like protein
MDTASPARWVPRPEGPEIAFFDTETTVPSRKGESYSLLEFGAILVCPKRLVEVFSYSTLIKPADLDAISVTSVRCNGISRESVGSAPTFADVADTVYAILHGRVWAGHNIVRFDCPRIKEAYAEIGRPAPEPKGLIDTLPLLTQRFGRRAGNMKMASLACYFGLGRQSHRSLDDVRMNLEVVKYCATVLFLEASLPDVLSAATPIDELPITRIDTDITTSSNETSILVSHIEEMKLDSSNAGTTPSPSYTIVPITEGSSGFSGYLEPEEVMTQHITVSSLPFGQFAKTAVYHKDVPLHLCCANLNVCFGVSTKFLDNAGRPKLNIVVEIPENLCKVLDKCDEVAHKMSQEAGSISQWRPLVKKDGYVNLPTVRLHIPTVANGDHAIYSTEMYQRESSGNIQKLVFTKVDASELDTLFVPGNMLDAFFDLDVYDYQQNAGIRLVAKRLVLHSK